MKIRKVKKNSILNAILYVRAIKKIKIKKKKKKDLSSLYTKPGTEKCSLQKRKWSVARGGGDDCLPDFSISS